MTSRDANRAVPGDTVLQQHKAMVRSHPQLKAVNRFGQTGAGDAHDWKDVLFGPQGAPSGSKRRDHSPVRVCCKRPHARGAHSPARYVACHRATR